jgi:hypothetical protein
LSMLKTPGTLNFPDFLGRPVYDVVHLASPKSGQGAFGMLCRSSDTL